MNPWCMFDGEANRTARVEAWPFTLVHPQIKMFDFECSKTKDFRIFRTNEVRFKWMNFENLDWNLIISSTWRSRDDHSTSHDESEIKCSFFESRDRFLRLSIGQMVIMVKKYPMALVRNDLIIMLTCSMVLNDTFWWLLMILVTLSTSFICNFVRKGGPIISKHLKMGENTWNSPKNVQMIHNSWIIMNIIYLIEDFRILDITWMTWLISRRD